MTENNQKTCQCDQEMAESEQSSVWDVVIKQTKEAQEKGTDPFLWSMQVSSNLSSAGVCIPSMELANVLVSYICWENNVPILWKFLEKALVLNMVPSMLVLALLSSRSVFLFLFSILNFVNNFFSFLVFDVLGFIPIFFEFCIRMYLVVVSCQFTAVQFSSCFLLDENENCCVFRVIPNRRVQPAAYRLYMELLKRHAFSLRSQINGPNYRK